MFQLLLVQKVIQSYNRISSYVCVLREYQQQINIVVCNSWAHTHGARYVPNTEYNVECGRGPRLLMMETGRRSSWTYDVCMYVLDCRRDEPLYQPLLHILLDLFRFRMFWVEVKRRRLMNAQRYGVWDLRLGVAGCIAVDLECV